MKKEHVNPHWNHFPESHFGRTVEDILDGGFFNSMDANIRESVKAYEMEIGVPGMTRKDLNINVRNGVLHLTGERKEHNRVLWHRAHIEFSNRQFQRSFILPPDANAQRISARCRHGLLRISIPKLTQQEHRLIDLQVNQQPGFYLARQPQSWLESVWQRIKLAFR